MTMPELLDAPIRAVGGDAEALVPMRRLDPAYRAVYPDGSELHVRADMADLREEIRTKVGAADAAGFDRFADWLERAVRARDRHLHRPQLLLARSTCVRSPGRAARLLRLGGFGALGTAVDRFFTDDRLHRIFSFQAMYAGIAPAEALRHLRRDHLHGHRRGRLLRPRAACTPCRAALAPAAAKAGRPAALRRSTSSECCAAPRRRGRRRRCADGERLAADAVVCTLDLPVAYDQLLPGVPRRRVRDAAALLAVGRGVARRRRGPRRRRTCATTTSTSAHEWDERLRGPLDARRADARPVAPGHRADRRPTRRWPRTAARSCTCWSRCPTWTAPSTGRASAGRMRERLQRLPRGRRLPHRRRRRAAARHPAGLAGAGHGSMGTPFALAHTFLQTGPFRPTNVDRRRARRWCSPAPAPVPGVGIPMVLISGKLAADRVGVRRVARPVPRRCVR